VPISFQKEPKKEKTERSVVEKRKKRKKITHHTHTNKKRVFFHTERVVVYCTAL
jgi:hypothetical protein